MQKIPNLLTIPGYQTALIQVKDLSELQALLERCADYSLLVTGSPPNPSDAALMLESCPKGKTLGDKFVIGFSTKKKDLFGVLDVVRDYPSKDDWWLGLLLLDPAQRNKGLGRRIYRSFERWAGHLGARRIYLGVVEENQKAYEFWRDMGFEVVERQPARQFSHVEHVVITMARIISEGSHD